MRIKWLSPLKQSFKIEQKIPKDIAVPTWFLRYYFNLFYFIFIEIIIAILKLNNLFLPECAEINENNYKVNRRLAKIH